MRDMLKKIREVLEVLVVGSILTALGSVLAMIKFDLMHQRALSFQSDPTQPGLLEISGDTLLRFQAFLESGGALVLFIGVFTSLLATYYSAKNDNLLLSVRLILTGENVQRFVYTIIKMANYLCTVFSISGCSIDGIAGSILYNGRSLSIMIAFCQMFVSFSRFMAVSFDGIFIRYTTKHAVLQFLICYSIAISLFCVSVFIDGTIVNIYLSPTLIYFMFTMDLFTFSKLRKLSNSKAASMAERRLMIQMIGNSTYYFLNYFVSSLFTIVQYPFFGYFLSNVALLVNSNVSTYIYTLGLSYINMVYLKKKLSSGSEKERYNNAVSPRSGKSTLVQEYKNSNSTPKI